MSLDAGLFYGISALVLVAGGFVVLARNLVHAAFWTMPCFMGVALLFLLLGNELLFTVQLLIYAGAIPITVLFVLMLTREVMSEGRSEHGKLWPLAVATALAFATLTLSAIRTVQEPRYFMPVPPDLTKDIGRGFLAGYLLPFELASLLLLGALVGAIYLARAEKKQKVRKSIPRNSQEDGGAGDPVAALADRSDASV